MLSYHHRGNTDGTNRPQPCLPRLLLTKPAIDGMPEQRRYGTTKGEKLAGLANSNAQAEATTGTSISAAAAAAGPSAGKSVKKKSIYSTDGGRRKTPVGVPAMPTNEGEAVVSEREPLLLDSSSDDHHHHHSGVGGGGGGGVVADAFAAGSSRRDNSKVLTTLLVLNYMIGSGILNAPQVFEASGIALATILFIVSGLSVC